MNRERADRVARRVADEGLDALLVTNLVNVRWLTGFTGTAGLAVVGAGPEGVRRFVTDFRYLTQSAQQLDELWDREISPDLPAAMAEGLPAEGPFRLGFEDASMTVKAHAALAEKLRDGVELVAAGPLVEDLRARKDAEELERIRAASRLADAALEDVLTRGLAGRTERDVALDLDVTMRRMGADAVSFAPIVAAGAHGALPHAGPRDVEIPAGTLCVIDWGAELDGYASDCTRTFHTGGELDPRDAEVYETVRVAQQEALEAVAAGRSGKELDAVAREIIVAAGHGEHFGHGLGHGVGAEVHEGPRLSQRSTDTLEAGHVVTVEPGVYVPGAIGVRIEDLVIVGEESSEVLTTISKDLRTVEPAG
jgi:Xaa-Pro aminopeptidase